MSFKTIHENKILTKISGFTVNFPCNNQCLYNLYVILFNDCHEMSFCQIVNNVILRNISAAVHQEFSPFHESQRDTSSPLPLNHLKIEKTTSC